MVDTFNDVNGDAFTGLDDEDDDLPFSIDGGPADDKETKAPSKDTTRKKKEEPQPDGDIFDDPVSDDSDTADPNDILNATTDDPDDNYADDEYQPFNKNNAASVQEYYNNPSPVSATAFNIDDDSADAAPQQQPPQQQPVPAPPRDNNPYMNDDQQDVNQPYGAPAQDNPFAAQQAPSQQYAPVQNNGQYESIPDAQQPPQGYYQQQPQQPYAPVQQPYQAPMQAPVGNDSDADAYQQQQPQPPHPQPDATRNPSSFSIPKPDMIARIIVVADTLRNDLNNDEKEAVSSVLDITAIQHDEVSEMVYAVLNARKSTMTALNDFLEAHEMDPSSRAFALIRLDDSELKKIVELGVKFGYDKPDKRDSTDHIFVAQSAEAAISGTPEPSISLMQSVYTVYLKSQEILHG